MSRIPLDPLTMTDSDMLDYLEEAHAKSAPYSVYDVQIGRVAVTLRRGKSVREALRDSITRHNTALIVAALGGDV